MVPRLGQACSSPALSRSTRTKARSTSTASTSRDQSTLIRFDSPNDALARRRRTSHPHLPPARRRGSQVRRRHAVRSTGSSLTTRSTTPHALVDDWTTARKTQRDRLRAGASATSSTAWTPEQLQLADARQHAVLRDRPSLAGVDPEELGVSTTSRTYSNQFDRRKAFLDFTLGSTSRPSRTGCRWATSPRAASTRKFNLDAFLRSDTKTRYQAYASGKAVGAYTDDEIREARGQAARRPPARRPRAASRLAEESACRRDRDHRDHRRRARSGSVFSVDVAKRDHPRPRRPLRRRRRQGRQAVHVLPGHRRAPARACASSSGPCHDRRRPSASSPSGTTTTRASTSPSRSPAAPRATEPCTMAEDGVWDGLSHRPQRGRQVRASATASTTPSDVPIHEISLTPAPVFGGAESPSVAFDAITQEGTP